MKYHNKRTVADGISFASQKEARVYRDLKILEKAGHIADLKLQPRIPILINGMKVCTYVADFLYFDRKIKKMVWLDAKGMRTPMFKLKAKLVLATTGITITEC